MKRLLSWFVILTLVASVGVACSDGVNQAACASTLFPVATARPGPSGGGSKPTPPKPSGSKPTSKPGSSSSKPTPPKTGTRASAATAAKPKVSVSGKGANRRTTITPPGEKAYTPPAATVKPSTQDFSTAKTSAPRTLTTSGGYTSSVTHHYYVYHEYNYFMTGGYLSAIDLFNPYDPFNYYYRPFSPFYGNPYMIGASCGGSDASEFKPAQDEYDALSAKLDAVNAKLDAGNTNLDDLDKDGAVTTTTTTTTTVPVTTSSSSG